MDVRELVTKIGFKINDAQLKAAQGAIANIKHSLEIVAGVGVAAAGSLFALARSAAETGEELEHTSARVGLSTQQLQEYQGVARMSGISTEDFNMSMQRFNKLVGLAASGFPQAIKTFSEFGISIRDANGHLKSQPELLSEIADKMNALPDSAQRTAMSFKLFFISGVGMVNMLSQGSKALEEQRKKVAELTYIYSDSALKASQTFQQNMVLVTTAVAGLKNEVGMSLLPTMNKAINTFINWYLVNKQILAQKITEFLKTLTTFVKTLWDMSLGLLGALKLLVDMLGGVKKAAVLAAIAIYLIIAARVVSGFMAIGVAIGALIKLFYGLATGAALADTAIAAIPLAIAAVITALAFIANDLYNFEKGNKSFTGYLVKSWEGWINKLKETHPVLMFILNALEQIAKISNQINPIHIATATAKYGSSAIKKVENLFSNSKLGSSVVAGSNRFPAQKTINSTVNVTVNTPAGTPQQQNQFLQDSATKIFNDLIDGHLMSVMSAYPKVQ